LSKKLIISLSLLLSVVVVVLILFWTLFALSTVTVQFHSNTLNLNITEKEIVEAGEFHYGASVLFDGKKKYNARLDKKVNENPNFAYLKVLNIETVFPNKYVVHVAEREELFAIEQGGQVLVCDRELRVLKILDEFVSTQMNAILVKGVEIKNDVFDVGDFLSIAQNGLKKFFSAFLQNNRGYAEQIGKYKEIQLGKVKDDFGQKEYDSITLTTFQGRKFEICNIDFAFANKVQLMLATESALFQQDFDVNGNVLNSKGEFVYVLKNSQGELIPAKETDENAINLTKHMLLNCKIKVDNLTLSDYVHRTEKDIYYSLVEI